jgi:hypothetical protein
MPLFTSLRNGNSSARAPTALCGEFGGELQFDIVIIHH